MIIGLYFLQPNQSTWRRN